MSIKAELTRFVQGLDTRVESFLNLEPKFKSAQANAKQLLILDLQKYAATQQAIADAAAHEVAHTNVLIQKINGGTLPPNTQAPSGTIRVLVEEAEAVEGAVQGAKSHWRWVWPVLLAAALIYMGTHWR